MTTQPSVRLTAQEYLRIERTAVGKSEFINGEMFGMGGASLRHTVIAANLVRELGSQLRNAPCVVASADLRVATDRPRHYTYPDVVVVCDPPQFVDGHFDTLTNPAFIAEVLSDSTEKYDRGAKSEHYRAMPSLSGYLLVSQDRIHVELYTRSNNGWLLHEWIDADATVDGVAPLRHQNRRDLRKGGVRGLTSARPPKWFWLMSTNAAAVSWKRSRSCEIRGAWRSAFSAASPET